MRGRERGRAAGAGKVRPWIPREAAAAGTPCPGLPPGPGGVDAGPHLEQGRAGPDGGGGGGAGGGAGRRRLLLPQPEAGGGGGGGGEVALKGAGASRVRTGARGRRSRRLRGGRGGAGGRAASPRGQNRGGRRIPAAGKGRNLCGAAGDGGGSGPEHSGGSLCLRALPGRQRRLIRGARGGTRGRACRGHTHSALLGKHASSGPDPSVLQLCRLRNQEATEAKANPACPVTPLGMVEAIHNGAGRLGRTVRTGCSHCSVWPQPPPPPPLQQPLGQQEAAAHSAAPTWWWLKTGGGGKTGLERPERN